MAAYSSAYLNSHINPRTNYFMDFRLQILSLVHTLHLEICFWVKFMESEEKECSYSAYIFFFLLFHFIFQTLIGYT